MTRRMRLSMRKLQGDTLLVATHNAGKLEEIASLLKPYGVSVIGAAEKNLPEPEETETRSWVTRESRPMQLPKLRACPPCRMIAVLKSTRLAASRVSGLRIGPRRKTGAIS